MVQHNLFYDDQIEVDDSMSDEDSKANIYIYDCEGEDSNRADNPDYDYPSEESEGDAYPENEDLYYDFGCKDNDGQYESEEEVNDKKKNKIEFEDE